MWQDNPDGSVKINQVIVVSKENYKMIILGKGGSKIKEIGLKSRLEMEKSFERRVHLFLFVKVREWENSPEYYSYMGLKLNKRD
jgi:GTP-binding protein Era